MTSILIKVAQFSICFAVAQFMAFIFSVLLA
jgi:hypothetical protein